MSDKKPSEWFDCHGEGAARKHEGICFCEECASVRAALDAARAEGRAEAQPATQLDCGVMFAAAVAMAGGELRIPDDVAHDVIRATMLMWREEARRETVYTIRERAKR